MIANREIGPVTGRLHGTNNSTERLIDEHETAARLGLRVATLRRWRWAGRGALPHVKLGSSVRYRPSDIDAFIAAGLRTSTSELGASDAA